MTRRLFVFGRNYLALIIFLFVYVLSTVKANEDASTTAPGPRIDGTKFVR